MSPALWLVACAAPTSPPTGSTSTTPTSVPTTRPTSTSPASPSCGDGVVDPGEGCDNGAANDDSSSCTSTCAPAVCGDGLLWVGVEACDDGGSQGGDGCTPSCRAPVSLELSVADAILIGEGPGQRAGTAVAGAGDVNGDGLGDILVGAPRWVDASENASGSVYLLYGPVRGQMDLAAADSQLTGAFGSGEDAGGQLVAGDLTGDGWPDLVVGAVDGLLELGNAVGAVYVLAGPPAGGVVDLAGATRLLGEDGTVATAGGLAMGDFDGDGGNDLAIGGDNDDSSGVTWIVRGPILDDLSLDLADGKVVGEAEHDLGWAVESPGDLNGDGAADLVFGAAQNDEGADNAGAAYLLLAPPLGVVSLADADTKLTGSEVGDRVGVSVSGAGDIDGDGSPDVLVGRPTNYEGKLVDWGEVLLVNGAVPSGPIEANALAVLEGEYVGIALGSDIGVSMAGVGDVDGDGHDDVLLGASQDGGATAYLVCGPFQGSIDLADADARWRGSARDWQVSIVQGAGDVDGDGLADLLIGKWDNDLGGANAGAAFLVLGASVW